MLTIGGSGQSRDCQGIQRRDFLRIGALGFGGLTLPSLLAARAASAAGQRPLTDKSVVLLFLCGGASQLETFDPKMDAPVDCRTMTGAVRTCLPGVAFGATFPRLANMADKLAVIRSFAPHGISDHKMAIREVLTAGNSSQASIGATYTRVRGTTDARTGMSTFAELIADEPDPEYQQDAERMRGSNGPGQLGAAYAAFAPGSSGQINRDMQLSIPLSRFEDRRAMLRSLDRLNQQMDLRGTLAAQDKFTQQAVELILGKTTRDALDLSTEDPKVLEKYDTSEYQIGFQQKRPSDLGKRMLLARRLCEAGCRFVTVGSAGWDHHANDKHSGMVEGIRKLGRPLDRAVSAFLEDVHQRGLSDQILLVIISEFGRTPKINKRGGRDHWPSLCPLILAGGGLHMGQVVGQSTSNGEEPSSEPLGFDHLLATMWHVLADVGQLRLAQGLPDEVKRVLEQATPIPSLT